MIIVPTPLLESVYSPGPAACWIKSLYDPTLQKWTKPSKTSSYISEFGWPLL